MEQQMAVARAEPLPKATVAVGLETRIDTVGGLEAVGQAEAEKCSVALDDDFQRDRRLFEFAQSAVGIAHIGLDESAEGRVAAGELGRDDTILLVRGIDIHVAPGGVDEGEDVVDQRAEGLVVALVVDGVIGRVVQVFNDILRPVSTIAGGVAVMWQVGLNEEALQRIEFFAGEPNLGFVFAVVQLALDP